MLLTFLIYTAVKIVNIFTNIFKVKVLGFGLEVVYGKVSHRTLVKNLSMP
jgi:hypothetical protein